MHIIYKSAQLSTLSKVGGQDKTFHIIVGFRIEDIEKVIAGYFVEHVKLFSNLWWGVLHLDDKESESKYTWTKHH